ncbi:MAG: hypothetical protein KIT14_05870 [bacterium]|nr:hypothetical protein [bacterium]
MPGSTVDRVVGPAPDEVAAAQAHTGMLVVYSSREVTESPTRVDPDVAVHTPYEVRSQDGIFERRVVNSDGLRTEPDQVLLPPGRYRVIASAQEYGTVTVPVDVVAGRTTTVHLDANDYVAARRIPDSARVRLGDGQIVGWVDTGS